ncbi:MAG: amidohydrolase [Gemmataceae bacterium]|nr:amidohydrolase [Gemmataceae bacterium]
MNYIDAHVHVWTPDLAHYPLAAGFRREDMQPPSFTPEELFKHMRPAGVNRVNLIQMSYYGFDNRYLLDMIQLHKGVFVGTAVIDPHARDVAHAMAALAKRRIRAFRIHPRLSRQPPARWLEPEGYARMFAQGAKTNQAMSCLIDPDALPELDRMCRRFPDTPVIIDHLCRIGADGTIRAKDVKALCALAAHKRVLVKVGAFYALGRRQPPYDDLAGLIQQVVRAFTPQRCLWESDCPFQVQKPHTYQASIDLVRTRLKFLTAQDRDWLLRRTAEEFFFGKGE